MASPSEIVFVGYYLVILAVSAFCLFSALQRASNAWKHRDKPSAFVGAAFVVMFLLICVGAGYGIWLIHQI